MTNRGTLHLRRGEAPSKVGEHWRVEGGDFAGSFDHEGGAYLLVLARERPTTLMNWMDGRAWASALTVARHRDFRLPTLRESAALVESFPGLCLAPEYWLWTEDTVLDVFDEDLRMRAWRRYQGGHESPLKKTFTGTIVGVRVVKLGDELGIR